MFTQKRTFVLYVHIRRIILNIDYLRAQEGKVS